MSKDQQFSDSDCEKLALKIKKEIFQPVRENKVTVFLCGADIKRTDSIRGKLASALTSKWYGYYFSILYPEDIFDELLYNRHSSNLLSLENLLAANVDAVVIIPESPGSIAELGAFVNSPALLSKVVCVLDTKYKKAKSFINQGPVRLVKEYNKDRVLYIDPNQIENEADKLRTVLKPMKSTMTLTSELTFFQVPNFLLPAIYLLEPVHRETLRKLVGYATNDQTNATTFTDAGLTTLQKRREIEVTASGFKITETGVTNYFRLRSVGSRIKIQQETNLLDEVRLEVLNLRLRKKSLSI